MPSPHDVLTRHPEFDWLRVIALSLLIVFHAAVGFSPHWHWYVVDPHLSTPLDFFLEFIQRWRVTLVFVVSGAALMLAMRSRSPIEIVRERSRRLLIPLLFAIVVVIPPQIYLERLQRGEFHGSYPAFLTHLFNGIYPAGNLSWHHLWFVPYVMVLSAVLLPLFGWMRSAAGQRLLEQPIDLIARHHLYWLLVVPLTLSESLLRLQPNYSHSFVCDRHGWAVFFLLMLLGGALALWPRLLAAVQRGRWVCVLIGIAAFAALDERWLRIGADPRTLPPLACAEFCFLSAANVLGWLLAITGFVTRYLRRGSPVLTYATDAALPVYILHQTLTVIAVYFLHRVDWPLALKLPATILFTVAGAMAVYEFAIRRSSLLRLLFGMRPSRIDSGRTATSRWSAPASSDRQPS